MVALTPGPSKIGNIEADDSQDSIGHVVRQCAMIPVEEVAQANAHYHLTHDHDDARGNEEEAASHTVNTNDSHQCGNNIHCSKDSFGRVLDLLNPCNIPAHCMSQAGKRS